MGYSYRPSKTEEARIAFARIEDVNVSFKDLCNVCSNVRGRRADAALEFLSEAAEGKRPIRYFNYNKRRGHVGELGGKKGGWPVKSTRIIRDLLINAMANAESKGLGMCKIAHIQANKQHTYPRMTPKGRRMRADLETAFAEIVLMELYGEAGKRKMPVRKTDERKAEEKKAEVKVEAKKADVQKAVEKKAEVKVEAVKAEEKKADAPKAAEPKKSEVSNEPKAVPEASKV